MQKETGLTLEGVGVGCPGLIDTEKGNVVYSNNLAWKNVPLDSVSADTIDGVDEARMQQLLIEKNKLMEKLNQIAMSKEQDKKAGERMNTIFPVIDGLKNHPITYDDEIVRQLIDCVVVESKEQIKIVFRGGLQVETTMRQEVFNKINFKMYANNI